MYIIKCRNNGGEIMALLNEFTADTDISLVDALILQKHTLVVKREIRSYMRVSLQSSYTRV